MKKFILDLKVTENLKLNANYVVLKLTDPCAPLPEMHPGQFAELRVDGSKSTFLRRPISINFVDYDRNEVWFLIQTIGEGTRALARLRPGEVLNVVMPLGNQFSLEGEGFSDPFSPSDSLLLIGGGVGTAPMLFLGSELQKKGYLPTFLLGARSQSDLLQLDDFQMVGELFTTTEDGSFGETGFVTHHSILKNRTFNRIYCCGPKPMMVAVARYAGEHGISCELSLENKMACGVGACLCCVENTKKGHQCVCTEGPVFNSKELLWQI